MQQSNGGGNRLPEPVTGKAPGPGPRAKDHPHHEGFSAAIQDAADEVARRWPDPASYDVTITLEARVDVENPGGIGEYRARFD